MHITELFTLRIVIIRLASIDYLHETAKLPGNPRSNAIPAAAGNDLSI